MIKTTKWDKNTANSQKAWRRTTVFMNISYIESLHMLVLPRKKNQRFGTLGIKSAAQAIN